MAGQMKKTRHPGIYKREGSKRTTYYVVEYVPGDDGKRKQKWHSGYGTLAEARAAQTEIRNRKATGTYVAPSKLSLHEFIEKEWLPAVKRTVRPSTFQSYEGNLRCHVVPDVGSTRLQHITPGMLNNLYGSLEEKGLSARTVRYVHTILRRVLADAVRHDRLARNPADSAEAPSASAAKSPRMRTWTAQELRAFLDQAKGDRLFAAWRLAAMTGARRGEVLGLRWYDLDLDAGTVSFSETLIGNREESTPKTESGRRSIELDPVTVAALRAHRKDQAEERLAFGPAYENSDLVFCREDGTAIWPRTFSRKFESHVKAADLPRIPLKNLRHTHATILLANGVQPKVIQERLGHSDIVITLRVYASAIPAMRTEATQKAAALIDGTA